MLVPDYDAADAAPTTEQIASAYRDVEEEVPWTPEFSCNLNVAAMHPDGRRKFVRYGSLAANLDIKTYDVGNMFVCTTDGSATNWGKLWVEYDISLFVPQLQPAGLSLNPAGGSFTSGGTVSVNQPFGTVPVSNAANVGITIAAGTNNNSITFAQPGTYLFTCIQTGTVVSALVKTAGSGMTLTGLYTIEDSTVAHYQETVQVVTTTASSVLTFTSANSSAVTAAVAYIAVAPASSL
jgi:hypothetical protein